jgi:type III secretion protein L
MEASDPRKVIKKGVFAAAVDAQSIVEAARREADQLLDEAQKQREQIRAEAHRAGYEEGLTRWNETILLANEAQDRLLKTSEQILVRLAVRVAEKIIGEHLQSSPDAIVDIVREVLKSIRSERGLLIQVNPDHVETLRQSIHRLHDLLDNGCPIKILANPAISPGGCTVESEFGVIDAQLETQLKCLEEALLRAAKK